MPNDHTWQRGPPSTTLKGRVFFIFETTGDQSAHRAAESLALGSVLSEYKDFSNLTDDVVAHWQGKRRGRFNAGQDRRVHGQVGDAASRAHGGGSDPGGRGRRSAAAA